MICNLGLYHGLFLCTFYSFVPKHILHVIILRTIYDLMFVDMTRIPDRLVYSDMLSGNFINYINITFFSFDSTCFNFVICVVTICTIDYCFLCNCLRFSSNIILPLCDTNELLIASTSENSFFTNQSYFLMLL
jgi:hypothetical protein